MGRRAALGLRAQAQGVGAETLACAALLADGWSIRGRRLRTPAGEVDIVAERDGLLAFVEVKRRPTLAEAAASLGARQRARLLAAAEIVLVANPGWGAGACGSTCWWSTMPGRCAGLLTHSGWSLKAARAPGLRSFA